MEAKVSIIVGTYKRGKELERAIESLLAQTHKEIEIIVVDDNADKIWNKKVEKVISKYSDEVIYILNKKNQGSAKTRNIGIKTAKGDYITFLDDDDYYLPNKIKNQLEFMVGEKLDFSTTNLKLCSEDDTTIEIRRREYIKKNDTQSLLRYHLKHHITGTDTMMFRSEYIKKIGGFEAIDVGDEFYLMQKAIAAKGKFKNLDKCDVVAYVHSETEGLSSGESKIKGENLLYEFKKQYFKDLSLNDRMYIKMRHYAVLAFAEVRRKNYFKFIFYVLASFLNSPIDLLRLFLKRK